MQNLFASHYSIVIIFVHTNSETNKMMVMVMMKQWCCSLSVYFLLWRRNCHVWNCSHIFTTCYSELHL